MQAYLIQSKKRTWTNKPGREALNLDAGQNIKITYGDRSITAQLKRAPASAARVMRAVTALNGMHGIAIDKYAMEELGAKPGVKVHVMNASIATVQRTSNRPASRRVETVDGRQKPAGTMKSRMQSLKIGEELEVSESAAKSGAYSVAKDLGIKIKRMAKTLIKRIE